MPSAKKPAAKKPAAKQTAPAKKATAAKKVAPAPEKKHGTRKDLNAPIDAWVEKQPQPQRAIVDALLALVREVLPEATSTIKWGSPSLSVDGRMLGAISSHKKHVNLMLWGPPESFRDPKGLLGGDGTAGRHLKLHALEELPADAVRGWLRTAAKNARAAT